MPHKIFIFSILWGVLYGQPLYASNPIDHHSFLYDGLPQLCQQSEGLPHIEDYVGFLDQLRQQNPLGGSRKESFLRVDLFSASIVRTEPDSEFISRIEQAQLDIRKQAMGDLTPFYKVYFQRKIQQHRDLTVLEDIVLSTQDLHHTVLDSNPDPEYTGIIFLGRSPCILQLVMEQIQKEIPAQKRIPLIHINYSGHPDALSKRVDPLNHGADGIARNMVSPEKRDFYMWYLASKRLQLYKKIYVVDMISSGGGLNSWIRLLKTFMKDKGLVMPKVQFMNITPFAHTMTVSLSNDIVQMPNALWTYCPKTHRIIYEKNEPLNVKALTLASTPIHMSHMAFDTIDNDCFQRYAVHGASYPAQMWRADTYAQSQKGGDWHKDMYAQLRPRIDAFLSIHDEMKKNNIK